MRVVGTTAIVALFYGVVPVWAQPAPAPAGGAATPTAYTKVAVNFESGVFEMRLPFDEPFLITGSARAGTRRLSVVWAADKSLAGVGSINLKCAPPYGGQPGPQPWTPTTVPTAAQAFAVLAGPLDAQRFVKFLFCSQVQIEERMRARIAEAARQSFDRSMRGLALSEQTPTLGVKRIDAELARLRTLLARELQLEPESYEITEGSLFSAAPLQAVRDTFDSALVAVVRNQSNRPQVDRSYVDGVQALTQQLAALRGSRLPELVTVMQASQNQVLAARVAASRDALALVGLASGAHDLWAAGRLPTYISVLFPDAFSSTDAAAYRDNFERLSGLLTSLDAFILATLGEADASAAFKELLTQLGNSLPAGISANVRSIRQTITDASDQATSLANTTERSRNSLEGREGALRDLAALVSLSQTEVQVVVGDSIQVSSTQSSPYVSADAGLIYMPNISDANVYVGVNIHTRPINKAVPLAIRGGLRRRLAMTVGLTLDSVKDVAGTRFGLVGDNGVVLGAGLRLTQSVKLAGGSLWFKAKDPNPARTSLVARSTWYVGLAFDADVTGQLSKIFTRP